MRKPTFCICENKDADQLRGNREADQRLCFCFIDSTIPLLSKFEISSLLPSSVAVQPGLCRTWSETNNNDEAFKMNTGGTTKFRIKKWRDHTIYVANTKVLICTFVFAYEKAGFLMMWVEHRLNH